MARVVSDDCLHLFDALLEIFDKVHHKLFVFLLLYFLLFDDSISDKHFGLFFCIFPLFLYIFDLQLLLLDLPHQHFYHRLLIFLLESHLLLQRTSIDDQYSI